MDTEQVKYIGPGEPRTITIRADEVESLVATGLYKVITSPSKQKKEANDG